MTGQNMRYLLRISCVLVLLTGNAAAQNYPEKQVTMIVPFPAGGAVDPVARALAQRMTEIWGQPVVVVNRPGAGGNIGSESVARSAPDGYVLLMGSTALAISPSLYPKMAYDVLKDLAPVSLVVATPNLLVVHPSLPVQSVKELLALAKAKPGVLTAASAGTGTSNHLSLVLFKSMAGVDILHVPYKGAAPALTDVMGGQVAMSFFPTSAAMSHVRSGKLRALAVTSAKRSPAMADLPTISEAGIAGYESTSWSAIMVPAGTPRDIINRIHSATVESLRTPKVKEVLASAGADAVGSTPDEFARSLREQIAKWAKVVKASGMKVD